jgi:hypothetical protein
MGIKIILSILAFIVLLYVKRNSMKKIPPWWDNICRTRQEIPHFYVTKIYITVFTTTRFLTLV